jgi:hypothetical protein
MFGAGGRPGGDADGRATVRTGAQAGRRGMEGDSSCGGQEAPLVACSIFSITRSKEKLEAF